MNVPLDFNIMHKLCWLLEIYINNRKQSSENSPIEHVEAAVTQGDIK